jgi:hypothetical protein
MATLGKAISTTMTGLNVSLRLVMPEMLVKEVAHLPDVVWELELATARRAVHRVLTMFESHYQGLDRMVLSGGWAPGISDAVTPKILIMAFNKILLSNKCLFKDF